MAHVPLVLLSDADSARSALVERLLRSEALRLELFSRLEEVGQASDGSDLACVVVGAPEAEIRVAALRTQLRNVPIIALIDDTGAPAEALLQAGADDVIRMPAQRGELVLRLRAQLRVHASINAISHKERDAKAMLELTQTLASALDFSEILYTVVRKIAEMVRVDRVSIVLAPEPELPLHRGTAEAEPDDPTGPIIPDRVGYVVAASDDASIQNLRINLGKYPEILEVLRTRRPVTIHDASTHPLLEVIRERVPEHSLGALTLLPIIWQEEAWGAIFLRARTARGVISERELDFCQIVANATAVALRNARVMQSLRDQTQQVNFARYEAERRLRNLKRYANLFASAAEGLAAVSPEGQLLFANPRAYEICGVSEPQLRGRRLLDLLVPGDQRRMIEIWRGVKKGAFPSRVDLRIAHPDGSPRVLSSSFANLLEGDGAVLFSFRDVTDERETAEELARTKDFLESLINASVDAIIAADLSGNILLFNKGAEKIYGYSSAEVLGHLKATELYPPSGAHQVMRMIRSQQHGGPGRLESVRFDALDRSGARIPINLSAAMIYGSDGKPFATVGIFTDLREKLRVEERLVQAQQRLADSEKHAMIAELAGTAAHELNQPLTSVIGYGRLLERRLPEESQEHHAVAVVVREAERMADIVRKLGKITRYETKSYVGQTKILDLDAAAADSEPGIILPESDTASSEFDAEQGPAQLDGVSTPDGKRSELRPRKRVSPAHPVLYTLVQEVSVELPESEIVGRMVEGFHECFPHFRCVISIFSDAPGEVAFTRSSHPLPAATRAPHDIDREALARNLVAPSELERVGIRAVPSYLPFFASDVYGVDRLVVHHGRVYGVMSVECSDAEHTRADIPFLDGWALATATKLHIARLLRESNEYREHLRQVIEHASVPILTIDTAGKIERVNREFLDATESHREAWEGKSFVDIFRESRQEAVRATLESALNGQGVHEIELRLPISRGGHAWIAFNLTSIVNALGEVRGIVGVGRDLTQVRALEERIIQAEKLATLGQLAAGVVHELNNPLTSISVYSDYLLTKGRAYGMEPSDIAKLDRISDAATRMLRFTRDLVTYARPSGEEPVATSMPEIIDQALVFCDHVVTESDVAIERSYQPNVAACLAVKGQLHQVFINLVTNACQALASARGTRKQRGTIAISVGRVVDDIEIRVSDNGPGIPPDHVERIFEPFFSTKGEGQGTGLGLSIVRNIVQQHGGSIQVETRFGVPNSGTAFIIRFPTRPSLDKLAPTRVSATTHPPAQVGDATPPRQLDS